ncbi:MAG: 16S rRNA (cytosine(1402)-N(4))-methyltransferase RsmH [Candidatus Eisenbacteria bacterium]|nr:16S rRNA (cytosine(1402)-N(4))-methyltransferase RsmH [Candidatus Eisenbacteria bacterium]
MKTTDQGSPPGSGFHRPVMVGEALGFLLTDPSGIYVDCTVGDGGHAERLLEELGPEGSLYGLDADSEAIERASLRLLRFGDRVKLLEKNFGDLLDLAPLVGAENVAGILFDLGLSSYHVDTGERGFSYEKDGPLDMRFSRKRSVTASQIVNEYSVDELAATLRNYGELKESRIIAKTIEEARKRAGIDTTLELVQILKRRFGPGATRSFLGRVFQALRIEVNQELISLKAGLEAAGKLLRSGGMLVVISYHSLEDRMVKEFVRGILPERRALLLGTVPVDATFTVLTPRAVKPDAREVAANPRARSARLRAARRK